MRFLICALVCLFCIKNSLHANDSLEHLPIPDRFEKNGVRIDFLPEISRKTEMMYNGSWSQQDRALFGYPPMTEAGGRLKPYLKVLEGLRPLILSKKHHFRTILLEEGNHLYILEGKTLGVGGEVSAKKLEKFLQKMK